MVNFTYEPAMASEVLGTWEFIAKSCVDRREEADYGKLDCDPGYTTFKLTFNYRTLPEPTPDPEP